MQFRHVFRHSYTFELRWEKMEHLVLGLEQTWADLDAALAGFLHRMGYG